MPARGFDSTVSVANLVALFALLLPLRGNHTKRQK
jgi:hypothetical protein